MYTIVRGIKLCFGDVAMPPQSRSGSAVPKLFRLVELYEGAVITQGC